MLPPDFAIFARLVTSQYHGIGGQGFPSVVIHRTEEGNNGCSYGGSKVHGTTVITQEEGTHLKKGH